MANPVIDRKKNLVFAMFQGQFCSEKKSNLIRKKLTISIGQILLMQIS